MKNRGPHLRPWRLHRKADVSRLGSASAKTTSCGTPDELSSFLPTRCHRGHSLRRLMILRQRKFQSLTDFKFDFVTNIGVFAQELPGVFTALPDAFAAEGKPRPALLNLVQAHSQVNQVAFLRDSLAIENIKFRLPKGSGHFIFNYFYFSSVANHPVALLDGGDPANIDAH